MGTPDDLLHYRLQLLQDVRALEAGIGRAATEKDKYLEEIATLNAQVKQFSTVLVAAGFDGAAGNSSTSHSAPVAVASLGGTKGRPSTSGAASAATAAASSIPQSLQEQAVVTQAELYANVDVMDPSIKDEESLHRLLASLQKSEKEMNDVLAALQLQEKAAAKTTGAMMGATTTAGAAAIRDRASDAEVEKLKAEYEAMQVEMRRIMALSQRPLGR